MKTTKIILGLNISFPWAYRGTKYKLLLSTFKNKDTHSRKAINELLKVYPKDIFNLDYFQQYSVFDGESKKYFFLNILIIH